MNIDEHPAIPGPDGASSRSRAVIAFVNGQPADGLHGGACPRGQVTAFIERLTKDKIAGGAQDLLAQAEGRAGGRRSGRRGGNLRRRAGRGSPPTSPRMAGLARAYFEDRPDRQGPSRPSRWCRKPSANDPAGWPRCGRRDGAGRAGPPRSGRWTELEQKVAANPLDHSGRAFDPRARAQFQGPARAGARPADRQSCAVTASGTTTAPASSSCQLFEAWGPNDEATLAGRKRFVVGSVLVKAAAFDEEIRHHPRKAERSSNPAGACPRTVRSTDPGDGANGRRSGRQRARCR